MRIKVRATLRMTTSGGRLRSSSDTPCELQRHLDDVETDTAASATADRSTLHDPAGARATGGTPITGAQSGRALQVSAH
jgi:hypothetical protein